MHGIIHKTLKEYVTEKMSEEAWEAVLDRADIDPKLYLPVSHYPDEEITAVIAAVSEMSGHPQPAIQRDFGEYLAPELLNTFKAHVKPNWETLDILESLEGIYTQIESQNEESTPPPVTTERIDPDTVSVEYRSDRQLCPLGKGIVLGIAREYDQDVTIDESACMLEGDDRCDIVVTRQ